MLCSWSKSIRSVFSRLSAASVARTIGFRRKILRDLALTAAAAFAVSDEVVADLGRDHDFVALLRESLRDQLFAQAVAVGVGGVKERDAEIERLVHERDRFAFGEISPPAG